MRRKNHQVDEDALKVQKWFEKSVTYRGETYTIDLEQAAAVADESQNAIVVARAGSGKTRTIVAKIVYLIAKCGVRPEEIMVFVFNANAAAEINQRLLEMMVDGAPVAPQIEVASTFHAFARKIVYDICGGRVKCGKILAGEKEEYMQRIVLKMLQEKKWRGKIYEFLKGAVEDGGAPAGQVAIKDSEISYFAKMMALFVNRAQQKYLGGETTVGAEARKYLKSNEIERRERLFVELGVECHRRYHWYLLDAKRGRLQGMEEYGTDFNLIVSWAEKLIRSGRTEVQEVLADKKYILIDEYQDFSQLFLAVVMAIRSVAKKARLFVVGDDWQAINRFAGSDVEYFQEFERYFPEGARRLEISTNYRCDYVIVDTARRFMQKGMREKGNFRAKSWRAGKVVVVSPKEAELWEIIKREKRAKDILILHRNNETHMREGSLIKVLERLKKEVVERRILTGREFDDKVRIMTMHKSKGLEAEVVIILEADTGVIPKIHPDTRLYTLFGETEEVAMDDQKRLFYVAMTRAKKRLYIIHSGPKRGEAAGFVRFLGRGLERWTE